MLLTDTQTGVSDTLISAALSATGEHLHASKFVLVMASRLGALTAMGGPRELSGALQLLFGIEVAAYDLSDLEHLAEDERLAKDPSLAQQRAAQAALLTATVRPALDL